jgi:spoIIIJ-associated protein
MKTVRIKAKTVEAAVEEGMKQLGITRAEAVVHVVEKPSTGLFGLLHKKMAVVDISAPEIPAEPEETPEAPAAEETRTDEAPAEAPAAEPAEPKAEEPAAASEAEPEETGEETPAEPEEAQAEEVPGEKEEEKPFDPEEQKKVAEEARKFLENVFRGMHLPVIMECMMNEERILFSLHGEGLGILIGKHGQTLDALQYLTNLAAGKAAHGRYFVMLDVENYRERRKDTLEALAKRLAGKVKRTGEPVKLEPMPAGERRIIHLALQDDDAVITESEGEAPYRYITIRRK